MTAATAEQTTNLYIPPYSETLEHIEIPQLRIGIQGDFNTGKTWASLTFPHVTVCDFNKGLGAHRGRADVSRIDFTNKDTLTKIYPRDPFNQREAFATWLETEAKKFLPEQTIVVDCSTDLEDIFHQWEEKYPTLTKGGKYDDFAEWANKIKYFGRIFTAMKALKCNFVWISHEQKDRNKDGTLNGKIRPLMSGQTADKIGGHFTDWIRQLCCDKKDVSKLTDAQLEMWKMTRDEFAAMQNTFPGHTLYFWQLESDDIFNAKISSLVNFPRFVPANYQSFIKYLRK